MSSILSILASVSASVNNNGGGGGGGGGGGPSYGSWTIEWWQKKLSPQLVGSPRVFAVGVDTGASIGYSNESGGDYVWTNGLAAGPLTVGSIANTWVHFAVVSNSVNLTVFKNGVALTSVPRTGNPITDSTTNFILGGDTNFHWKGRITDFHIIKGFAKYTANFVPPTRLIAESGTVLLLPFNNTFTASVGPSATTVAATLVEDDPWNDAGGSVEFIGNNTSFLSFTGQSAFALDVA